MTIECYHGYLIVKVKQNIQYWILHYAYYDVSIEYNE